MPFSPYGRFANADAPEKNSTKINQRSFKNNLTRRNAQLTELHPSLKPSSSLASANVKALRMFRHVCRMLPFILKIHELHFRVTPVQSKRYVANWFRRYSKETNLQTIDEMIEYGYKTTYEAQMDYSNSGYLYKYILPPTHNYRDHGINHFYNRQANTIKQVENTKFLSNFYRGNKTHNV